MKEEKRCANCGGEIQSMLGILCDACYLQAKLDLERRREAPYPYASPAAGNCGKCGAPYTISVTGQYQPICCCWNLPQIKTTSGTNT